MSVLTFYGVPGKMTRRLLGVVIGTQGLVVFFGALVARALAAIEGSGTSGSFLAVGSVLAVACILDAGLFRRPWGVTVGWVLQAATLACALIVPAMLLVGLLFGALWLTALVQGHNMDEHTRRIDAQWHASQETPSEVALAQGRPAVETLPQGALIQQAPSEGTLAPEARAAEAPVQEVPVAEALVQEVPAAEALVQEVPIAGTPAPGKATPRTSGQDG